MSVSIVLGFMFLFLGVFPLLLEKVEEKIATRRAGLHTFHPLYSRCSSNAPYLINKYMIPSITTEQMIEVDRLMIEVYKIELIQMMENAGRCLALTAKRHFFKGEI